MAEAIAAKPPTEMQRLQALDKSSMLGELLHWKRAAKEAREKNRLWMLENKELKAERDELQRQIVSQSLEAAQKVCEIYFNIASEAIGEDEVRRRRDAVLAKDFANG